jgi:hypothetical protein
LIFNERYYCSKQRAYPEHNNRYYIATYISERYFAKRYSCCFSKHGMQAGFPSNCLILDSITFSLHTAHGIDLRIFAGSGSGMDVGFMERILSMEAVII